MSRRAGLRPDRLWTRWRNWWPASLMKTDRKNKKAREELVLEGLGVAPGVAIGPAYVREAGDLQVVEYHIPASKVKAEKAWLAGAARTAVRPVGKRTAQGIATRGRAARETSARSGP